MCKGETVMGDDPMQMASYADFVEGAMARFSAGVALPGDEYAFSARPDPGGSDIATPTMSDTKRGRCRGEQDAIAGRVRADQFIHFGTYGRYQAYWDAYLVGYRSIRKK
jgi:hypothetical protein